MIHEATGGIMKNMTLPLPDDVFELIEREADLRCLKPMHVAREAVLEKYRSGVSAVSGDFRNHVASSEIMQSEKAS
jgi:hypothetical protein